MRRKKNEKYCSKKNENGKKMETYRRKKNVNGKKSGEVLQPKNVERSHSNEFRCVNEAASSPRLRRRKRDIAWSSYVAGRMCH